jgi:hypothetical protein
MWIGTYQKWNPNPPSYGKRYEVDAVHDDYEGFRIWFRPHDRPNPFLIAKFENPLFYASSDESNRLTGATNDISDEFPHLFWTVLDSSLTTEFQRQSCGIINESLIVHYCFLSCNQCVDVLSVREPQIIQTKW